MIKIEKYLDYFRLKHQLENYKEIHSEIEKSIGFKGTNLWVLMFAIIVASVGLNMNSPAVIIGAMLISPLMGPITGMGYSLATYDFILFKESVNNYLFAVIVSLLTSALYFFISPLNTAHSELLARTSPTIYDVLIAFFGGSAGILAISSKLKGNVIPGVAIATALMPPICTAGYGLATLQFNFFFGALYLFTINTVFIGVAAMVVAQVLKFPISRIENKIKTEKISRYITIILIITIIPSIFFGYNLVQKENFLDNSKKFINEVSVKENSYLLDNKINANTRKIQLLYSGYGLKKETIKEIKDIAYKYGLDTSKIVINTGTDAEILNKQTAMIQSETELLNSKLNATTFFLQRTQAKLDSIEKIPSIGNNLLKEIKQIYPQIQSCAYSETNIYPDTIKKPIIVFTFNKRTLTNKDKSKIEKWLQNRLERKDIKVIFN